ncbi:MAG TPA: OmpA family protein [Gemmatimonadales bacterium]|nr:OmpA family protein [Gemmatimonadales bacterium]
MPARSRILALAGAAVALLVLGASPAEAQFGKKLKDALKQNAENKAVQKAVEKQDEAIESAATGGADSAKAAEAAPAAEAAAGAESAAAPGGAASAGARKPDALKPGEGAWANYDFKPGDRVLYVDDFTNDEVGDFPKRMEFKSGALEIVEWQGARYLRATSDSKFLVTLPEVLPERFTMEFDYSIPSGGEVWISFGDENKRVEFGGDGTSTVYNSATQILANGNLPDAERGKLRRGRVLADGKYVKVYLDDTRVLNVPNGDVGRADKILFYTDADAKAPTLFGNFRVAAGGKKLYDALSSAGRVATQGIYFDTGSDRIRPESSPTLKEIGAMLKEHADLKLTIEGHTDNVGTAASNLALSEKRAAAVRQALIDSYRVDGARLQAKGLGQTKPAGSNDTPEGRQSNRRVELVRQ